jgi:hypothetical protein
MARPQTSHKKASSAFRRDRIMNETGNEGEEYTPNTGNLELESLQQVNIDSDRSNGSYDRNYRANGDGDKHGKQRKGGQGDRYEKEKYEELTKTKSNQFLDVHDSSDGSYSDVNPIAYFKKLRMRIRRNTLKRDKSLKVESIQKITKISTLLIWIPNQTETRTDHIKMPTAQIDKSTTTKRILSPCWVELYKKQPRLIKTMSQTFAMTNKMATSPSQCLTVTKLVKMKNLEAFKISLHSL